MVPYLGIWPSATVVCVGSGPSLDRADVELARWSGAKILAVNSAYTCCPPDALFAADAKWWGWHPDALDLPCLKFAFPPNPPMALPGVDVLDWTTGDGLDLSPTRLRSGGHSGYAAVNLAVHLGARRIVLLGYDCAPGPSGNHHFHADHPDGSHLQYPYRRSVYQTLLKPLQALGITLVNASRRTAIPIVPRMDLEAALCPPRIQ